MDSWTVIPKENSIAVFCGSRYYGDYILLKEPYCLKCAYPSVTTEKCTWHWDDYGFERLYAMGVYLLPTSVDGYRDLLSKHIRGLKKFPAYSLPLGLALAECVRMKYPELLDVDLIVPVPLHETELKVHSGKRYNQAIELSKVLSDKIKVNYVETLRKVEAVKMKGLARTKRKGVVRGLYDISNSKAVSDKRILLVDDVSTSGATVSECSRVLMDSGARTVNVLVAGRDKGTY